MRANSPAEHDTMPNVPVVMVIAAAAVLAVVVVVALGRGGELAFFQADYAPLRLDEVSATDVVLSPPPLALWGYNSQATDEALNRIADALTERDIEIATLRQQVADLTVESPANRRRAYLKPGRPDRADPPGSTGEGPPSDARDAQPSAPRTRDAQPPTELGLLPRDAQPPAEPGPQSRDARTLDAQPQDPRLGEPGPFGPRGGEVQPSGDPAPRSRDTQLSDALDVLSLGSSGEHPAPRQARMHDAERFGLGGAA